MSVPTAAFEVGGDRPLTARPILRFYAPLVLNAWLMTLAGPVLNVAVARAREPRLELAAFWLAFGVLLFAQSACLVLQQVTAARLARRHALAPLALTGALAGAVASAIVLALALTPLGDLVFVRLLAATPRTAALARDVLAWMAPIPLLVAARGVANGVAVAGHRTGLLALATFVRVVVLAAMVALVLAPHARAGALPAAWALLAGAAVEACFVVAATLPLWRRRLALPRRDAGGIDCGPVLRAAVPLAVSSFTWTLLRPLLSGILGRLADPELAQASLGVVMPLLMVGCAPLWGLLEVALVLPRRRADVGVLARFAAATAALFALGLGVLTATPLLARWLHAGLAPEPALEAAVRPALALLALEPLALAARAFAQGLLVRAGRSGALLVLAPLRVALTLAVGTAIATLDPHVNGAVLAIGLIVGGDALDALLLGVLARRALSAPGELSDRDAFPAFPASAVPDDERLVA